MADTHSTDFVMGVVRDLTVPKSALLDAFFPMIQAEESEEIHFDKLAGAKKLAPFVAPVNQGQVVQALGYTTKTFKPAYIKPKTPIDPSRPLQRAAGEQIGGRLSARDRADLIVVQELENHIQYIRNRMEWMAAKVLLTGKVTISGEGYQTTEVDFSRTSGHTVTLAGSNKWDDAASTPRDDLQDWADLISENSGGTPVDVVMESGAWKAFRNHADIKEVINFRRSTDTLLAPGAIRERGLTRRGELDGFTIWTYQDWYEDSSGNSTPFLPSGSVLMVSGAIDGVQAFGAIQDPKAGYVAMPFYPKTWYEEDPGRDILMTQSAPLVVPQRPDASLAATVI